VRLLLGHKADVNVKDNDGRTAKHRAVENGHETEVRLLVKHKMDVDAKTVSQGSQQVKPSHQARLRPSFGRRI
jgi:ankyrin repeat protein